MFSFQQLVLEWLLSPGIEDTQRQPQIRPLMSSQTAVRGQAVIKKSFLCSVVGARWGRGLEAQKRGASCSRGFQGGLLGRSVAVEIQR